MATVEGIAPSLFNEAMCNLLRFKPRIPCAGSFQMNMIQKGSHKSRKVGNAYSDCLKELIHDCSLRSVSMSK